jgi:hypothetical protein
MHPRTRRLARLRSTALVNPLPDTTPTCGGSFPLPRKGEAQTNTKLPRENLPVLLRDLMSREPLIHRIPVLFLRVIREGRRYALSRTLPLSLLRFRILRPAFVLMRLRKPCSLFLFLTLGWYVLFKSAFPQAYSYRQNGTLIILDCHVLSKRSGRSRAFSSPFPRPPEPPGPDLYPPYASFIKQPPKTYCNAETTLVIIPRAGPRSGTWAFRVSGGISTIVENAVDKPAVLLINRGATG